jgi:hypothetical protein
MSKQSVTFKGVLGIKGRPVPSNDDCAACVRIAVNNFGDDLAAAQQLAQKVFDERLHANCTELSVESAVPDAYGVNTITVHCDKELLGVFTWEGDQVKNMHCPRYRYMPEPEVSEKRTEPKVSEKRTEPEVLDKTPEPKVSDEAPDPEVSDKAPEPEVLDQASFPCVCFSERLSSLCSCANATEVLNKWWPIFETKLNDFKLYTDNEHEWFMYHVHMKNIMMGAEFVQGMRSEHARRKLRILVRN